MTPPFWMPGCEPLEGGHRLHIYAAVALALAAAPPLGAQLPSASAVALAMGENRIAVARGYDALSWNPAGLAMPDAPRSSLAVLPVRAASGLHRVSLALIQPYLDTIVPPEFHRGYVGYI